MTETYIFTTFYYILQINIFTMGLKQNLFFFFRLIFTYCYIYIATQVNSSQ